MTNLNDILHHHDAYNLEGDVEKVLLGLGFKAADFHVTWMNFLADGGMRIELQTALQNGQTVPLDEPTNHLDMESIIY